MCQLIPVKMVTSRPDVFLTSVALAMAAFSRMMQWLLQQSTTIAAHTCAMLEVLLT